MSRCSKDYQRKTPLPLSTPTELRIGAGRSVWSSDLWKSISYDLRFLCYLYISAIRLKWALLRETYVQHKTLSKPIIIATLTFMYMDNTGHVNLLLKYHVLSNGLIISCSCALGIKYSVCVSVSLSLFGQFDMKNKIASSLQQSNNKRLSVLHLGWSTLLRVSSVLSTTSLYACCYSKWINQGKGTDSTGAWRDDEKEGEEADELRTQLNEPGDSLVISIAPSIMLGQLPSLNYINQLSSLLLTIVAVSGLHTTRSTLKRWNRCRNLPLELSQKDGMTPTAVWLASWTGPHSSRRETARS